MSLYTTEVRFICEQLFGMGARSHGMSRVEDIIAAAAPKVFDFPWPIFDEDYRLPLEVKILRHFYTREICEETVGLWQLRLDTRMNDIMPYYNKLYESELLVFDPLRDTDLWTKKDVKQAEDEKGTRDLDATTDTERSETGASDSKANEKSTGTSRREQDSTEQTHTTSDEETAHSDTPQGTMGDLRGLEYLTDATIVNDEGTSKTDGSVTDETTSTSNSDSTANSTSKSDMDEAQKRAEDEKTARELRSTEDYLQHLAGKSPGKSYAQLLTEYRTTLLNIDRQIIGELEDLFFGLWD